jgi:hypothetical protein
MMRLLSVLCLAFMLIPVQSQTNDAVSYEKLLEEAMADFGPRATRLNEEYKLGSYRWDLDQTTGKLIFSDGGVPRVIANAQIVGSYSTYSNTWMWSWANQSIDENMKKGMGKIKEYGEKHKFKELVTPKWACDENYGWTMTAVAGYLLKAKGAYRGPIDDGYVYMLITEIKRADDKR